MLERRTEVDLGALDVYATVVGGVQVTEPAADLPLALALVSATTGRQLASDTVAAGEVGLGGEVRQVVGIERRLNEAHRLGFPAGHRPGPTTPEVAVGLDVVRVSTVAEAVAVAGLLPGAAGEAGRDPCARQGVCEQSYRPGLPPSWFTRPPDRPHGGWS
ncbi:MAG: hypothetical protein Ct9H300mP31_03040 [Acidimicrobiaceae bacterium]|nr:MAG: hypothetical protein Ct9H300mP31_03040 [Acidimicrobiaceae bacterium]